MFLFFLYPSPGKKTTAEILECPFYGNNEGVKNDDHLYNLLIMTLLACKKKKDNSFGNPAHRSYF